MCEDAYGRALGRFAGRAEAKGVRTPFQDGGGECSPLPPPKLEKLPPDHLPPPHCGGREHSDFSDELKIPVKTQGFWTTILTIFVCGVLPPHHCGGSLGASGRRGTPRGHNPSPLALCALTSFYHRNQSNNKSERRSGVPRRVQSSTIPERKDKNYSLGARHFDSVSLDSIDPN